MAYSHGGSVSAEILKLVVKQSGAIEVGNQTIDSLEAIKRNVIQ